MCFFMAKWCNGLPIQKLAEVKIQKKAREIHEPYNMVAEPELEFKKRSKALCIKI